MSHQPNTYICCGKRWFDWEECTCEREKTDTSKKEKITMKHDPKQMETIAKETLILTEHLNALRETSLMGLDTYTTKIKNQSAKTRLLNLEISLAIEALNRVRLRILTSI